MYEIQDGILIVNLLQISLRCFYSECYGGFYTSIVASSERSKHQSEKV